MLMIFFLYFSFHRIFFCPIINIFLPLLFILLIISLWIQCTLFKTSHYKNNIKNPFSKAKTTLCKVLSDHSKNYKDSFFKARILKEINFENHKTFLPIEISFLWSFFLKTLAKCQKKCKLILPGEYWYWGFFLQVLNTTKLEHFRATFYLLANLIFSHLHRISYHSLWHMADADHDIGHKTTWHTLFDLVNLVLKLLSFL